MTAVLLYYLDKKEHRFYSLHNWEITTYGLSKAWKRTLGFLFIVEVLLLPVSVAYGFPITLFAEAVMGVISSAYVVNFAMKSTSEELLMKQLLYIVKDDCKKKGAVNSYNQLSPLLLRVLDKLNYGEAESRDLIRQIAKVVVNSEQANVESPAINKYLLTIIEHIVNSQQSPGNRVGVIQSIIKDNQTSVNNITVCLIPFCDTSIEDMTDDIMTLLRAIENSETRNAVAINILIYNKCLDLYETEDTRVMLNRKIRGELCVQVTNEDIIRAKLYGVAVAQLFTDKQRTGFEGIKMSDINNMFGGMEDEE